MGVIGEFIEIYIKKVIKNWIFYGKNFFFGGEGLLVFYFFIF